MLRATAATGLVVVAVACQQASRPPYDLALAVEGGTPRFVTAFHETTVPLSVTNTGQRAWDPAHVHVSYHWLWLVPRELASRRNVPYQDGIRTELGRVVPPGATLALDARLLPPACPGLYWLQWDMVDEGATWFAQVAPRQPRHLVAVLPMAADLFAPVPLLIAVLGLVCLGRMSKGREPGATARGWIAAADVLWLVATLVAKQVVLVQDALLEPTAVAYWLTVVAAALPALVLMALPRRRRGWALFACGAIGTVLILSDVVYYRFFGDVMSAPALLGAHQTVRVWGSIRSLLTPDLAWLLADLPLAAWLVVRLRRSALASLPLRRERLVGTSAAAALVVIGGVLAAPGVLSAAPLDQMFRDRAVVERLGPFGFHAYDTWNYLRSTILRPVATASQIDDARRWFVDREPLRERGPLFGAAAGRNLIVVQVESLQDFVVDYRVGTEEVMPHLRRWTDGGIRFTNVTDQTSEGRTSDAEFVAMTSLLPLEHGAVAFRYPANHYIALPRVLADHGYATVSAVPFEPGFWNRRVMHPAYGFQQSLFEPDFQMTEQIGWGLNDRDFLQQMVPRLERLPRPFCAWLITLSLHHPFEDFPDAHKVLRLGALERTSFGNYLHTMRFFDEALEIFRQALARDGLLDDSVLVVFGDHDAGFPPDAALAKAIGLAPTPAAWALSDRVPLFVHLPAAARVRGDVPHTVTSPAGQTDFGPTLLALVGIDPAPLPYVGRNLLGRPDNPPVLRPYGDWLNRTHLFMAQPPAGAARSCYAIAQAAFVDEEACRAVAAHEARVVSRLVVADDLQEQLRALLADAAR